MVLSDRTALYAVFKGVATSPKLVMTAGSVRMQPLLAHGVAAHDATFFGNKRPCYQ
jgi:hypothetical protein